jgi:hypothetical protein
MYIARERGLRDVEALLDQTTPELLLIGNRLAPHEFENEVLPQRL